MKIVCLMENTPGESGCAYEHGLSYYIETHKHKLLADTGASSAFLENAKRLRIDMKQVEMLFLSHGHYDHAGGIKTFLTVNKTAPVYMQKEAVKAYYHKSETEERYIGISPEILQSDRVKLLDGITQIDEDLSVFNKVQERRLWPLGNLVLKEKVGDEFVQDEFLHEQYLVIRHEQGNILVSGCAHNGILNILQKYHALYKEEPKAVFSGFHMRRKDGYSKEDLSTIRQIAEELKTYRTVFYTGHCTGEEPFRIMKEIMGSQLVYLHSGDTVIL